jgi:glycosyltransferase involved in cell wall biosynthesis
MKPRNTVIIISYNQEDLIGRALDSILCQREFVFEIVISDDCSTDKTWEVLQEYKKTYPDIIKPFRNLINLGIFENMERARAKASGDVIWFCVGGDDKYCDGLFEEANRLIEKYNIDFSNEAFTLYFDYKAIAPNGEETIYRNNLIEHYNPVSLKIRQLISNRTIGYSRKVLEKLYPIRKNIGIYSDGLMDIQIQFFSNKNYYCHFVGSIYYTNIGISSISSKESMLKSGIVSLEQLKFEIPNISKEDKRWLNYRQIQYSFSFFPCFRNYLSYLKYFFLIIQDYYGWSFIKREIKYITKDTIRLILFATRLRKSKLEQI